MVRHNILGGQIRKSTNEEIQAVGKQDLMFWWQVVETKMMGTFNVFPGLKIIGFKLKISVPLYYSFVLWSGFLPFFYII